MSISGISSVSSAASGRVVVRQGTGNSQLGSSSKQINTSKQIADTTWSTSNLNELTAVSKSGQGVEVTTDARQMEMLPSSEKRFSDIFQSASSQRTLSSSTMDMTSKADPKNLNMAQFDFPAQHLENLEMSQIRLLMDPQSTLAQLQEATGMKAQAVLQAQEALNQLGFDQSIKQATGLSKEFFLTGKPNTHPNEAMPKTTAGHAQVIDRNWGHFFGGDKRGYRIFFDIMGLNRAHPTVSVPYGTSRTVQPNGVSVYRAPLMGNQALMFGSEAVSHERMMGLGILAAWRLLSNWTKDRFGDQNVEIFGVEVEVTPIMDIYSDFSATAEEPDARRFEEFLRHMLNYGKETMSLDSYIYNSKGEIVAKLTTRFALLLSSSGQQKASDTLAEQTAMGQDTPLLSHGKRPKLSLRKLLKSLIHRRRFEDEPLDDFS